MIKIPCLLIMLAAFLHSGAARAEDVAFCGGRAFPFDFAFGPTPHVELEVDGKVGAFLLDYGATKGTLWTNVREGAASTRTATVALPGIDTVNFLLQPSAGGSALGAPAGIIGTDVLSRLTVQLSRDRAWISTAMCDSAVMSAAGFRAIDQTGFFAADPALRSPSRPNVPVLFLRFDQTRAWAQIDTGYADAPGSNSIDINQALFDVLNELAPLVPDDTITVTTCDGVETRSVYRAKKPVTVTDARGGALAEIVDYRLILKRLNGCGGIASSSEPAAQIGSSLIAALTPLVFDPDAHRVWIRVR